MASTKSGLLAKTNNAVAAKKPTTIKGWIVAYKDQIAKALPSVMTPERFTRIALTAVSNNPQLAQCTPMSFLGAMMQSAQLGLEPNTPLGQAYLIPYRNKGTLEAQFQIGYKGLIDLAYRSGEITDIAAHVVYENDVFEFEYGLTPKLVHKPVLKNRGSAILYYGVYHTKSGGYGFEVMSVEDIDEYKKKFSQSANSKFSPWTTNFDAMAKKTVLKQLLKYAPIKTDFVRAVTSDETIKSNLSEHMAEVADETTIDMEDIQDEPANSENPKNVDMETGEILENETPSTAN